MINKRIFGKVEKQEVLIYSIEFPGKLKAEVMNYGAILVSLEVPDNQGELGDVVLGYDSLEDYVERNLFFGTITGRHAGRIGGGKFLLDSKEHQVTVNNGPNHLHGGTKGFDKVVWKTKSVNQTDDKIEIIFSHLSEGGHEGFPGNLSTDVKYVFSDVGFTVEYSAQTDKPTVVNLTNHSYFNLGGMKRDTLDHELIINAKGFLELDSTSVPTGEIIDVKNSPFDFNTPKIIEKDILEMNDQLQIGNGYDHSFVIDNWDGKELIHSATLSHVESGRSLEVWTTEPSVHLYTANYLNESIVGKGGKTYPSRFGVCLETQHFPNSPNQPSFPSVRLNPGDDFFSKTEYRFLAKMK